jgi:hypothetical protein
MVADSGGDVVVAGVAECAEGEVAKAGHRPGRGAGVHARGVLGIGGVANVVDLVLDASVTPYP